MAELIIDDLNYTQFIDAPPGQSRGMIPRDFNRVPYGSIPVAAPFDIPLIPRSEWDDKIADMERTKTRLSDLTQAAGVTVLDQNGTNYCWCNAPTFAMMILRVVQNQPIVRLSAASAAAKIKNYRNVGGWGGEAIEYIAEHGVATEEHWPRNAINRKYDTEDMRANASLHRFHEWYDLKPRNFDQLMTMLFLRIPVAIGLNWWSHEVTACDPVKVDGTYGVRIANSWGAEWGTNGYGILLGNKAVPDDHQGPRVATAS